MVKHIVMWRLKEEASGNEKEDNAVLIKEKLEALKNDIPEIKSIEVGIDIEGSAAAFDVVLVSEFETESDLNSYQVHPKHQEAAGFVKTVVTERAVVDYVV